MNTTQELTHQLMLVQMDGVSYDASLEMAQGIAAQYRELFPESARTRFIFQFDGPFRYAMSYDATQDGPEWVENAIKEAVEAAEGTCEVIHMAVNDITGLI